MFKIVAVLSVCLIGMPATFAFAAPQFCATPDQAMAVQAKYAAMAGNAPAIVSAALGLTEATVLSGLPNDQVIAVEAKALPKVWASMAEWSNAITLVKRDGHEFEINGPVHAATFNESAGKLDLTPVGWGLGGHINALEIGGVFAISLPTKSALRINGVMLTNQQGEVSLAVMVPAVRGRPSESITKEYMETANMMRSLPKLCP